jgi:hypothetical protein
MKVGFRIANFLSLQTVISAYHSQQLVTSKSANNLVGEFSNSSHSSLLSFARP